MEYEKARKLLVSLQYIQIQSAKHNGRWSPASQSKIEKDLKQLLAGLMGRDATDEEIEKAQSR
jgi:hypothetical protein|tara:strand:- start:540 stop:728 length:189 start_codon:yes stop_codon:yes gene_type:complete